jgi:DNA-binding NarL/FixJ family response regulator
MIVADDRRLCRECLKLLIETIDPRLDVVEAVDVDQIGPLLEQGTGRSVVLYNLVMADREGVDFVRTLAESIGDFPLVVMCDAEDNTLMRGVLERGAKAFLPSSTPGPLLVAILHLIIAGGVYAPPAMVMGLSANTDKAAGRDRADERREQLIAENFPTLTPRQSHVLALLSQGLTNRDIAGSLNMCENTVKAHVKQVMRKLSADNRTQAALMADRLIA